MRPEEIEELINTYLGHLLCEDGEIDMRLLRAMCRDIERETRHRAVSSIYALASAVDGRADVRAIFDQNL